MGLCTRQEDTTKANSTKPAIDISPLKNIAIQKLILAVFSKISAAEKSLEDRIALTSELLSTLPEFEQDNELKPNYCRNTKTEYIYLDDENLKKLELTLKVAERGIFAKQQSATLLLQGNCNELFDYSVTYEIPKSTDQLSECDLELIHQALENLVLHENYTPIQEQKAISFVANFIGLPSLCSRYFQQRYKTICTRAANEAKDYLEQARSALGEMWDAIVKKCDEISDAVSNQALHAELEMHKLAAERKVLEKVSQLERELQKYEEKFKANLNQQRDKLKKDYTTRQAELKKTKKNLIEREQQLEASYAEKLAELDKRLSGHREKVHANAFKILPRLEEIFPDVHFNITPPYSRTVDHHLRVFYQQLMIKDVSDSEHLSIEQALDLITIFRKVCIPLNRRPESVEMRDIYLGVRAVFDYVAHNDITCDDLLKLLHEKYDKLRKSKTGKTTVEKFLESVIPYDFDMQKYKQGLHNLQAKNKEELGVK